MKFLSVLILSIIVSFLTVIPAYYNDTGLEENQLLRVTAGRIWNQRRDFNIQEVNVKEGEIEVIIEEMTPKLQTQIHKIANPFKVALINQRFEGRDSYIRPKSFTLTEGKSDVECDGEDCRELIFQLQNAPYVSHGFLMLPLRQVFTMLDESSDGNYELKWVGGEKEIIEVLTNSGLPLQISFKNNTITIIPYDETYSLDGKIEILDGVAYFPCSLGNLRYIVPSIKITQDIEEMNIEIYS